MVTFKGTRTMEMWRPIVFFLVIIKHGVLCDDAESQFWRLPRLFHLDDFDRCMDRNDGLYCVGEFEIYNELENNPLYDLIQEKSQDRSLFNRSLLHRGYCLPTRCPSSEANTTARFERCVDDWAREHSLRARIHMLHYCRARGQQMGQDTNDVPHQVFLYIVCTLLLMNVIGTVYDLKIGQKGKKNKFLMMFSLRVNFIKLTAGHEVNLRSSAVLNLLKALLLSGAIFAHVVLVTAHLWHQNTRFFEKLLTSPLGGMLGALTTTTQMFVVISNFLTTFHLLSMKTKLSFKMVPLLFLKRVLRMLPVYLLVNAFSATWWNQLGVGPLWPVVVGSENIICREKFWYQAFFLQNMFEPHRICNVQTWVMAVDIQLYIISLFISIYLINHQENVTKIFYTLLAGAAAITGGVVLSNHFLSMSQMVVPENVRSTFRNDKSFTHFFLQPVNCLITMLFGIHLGFMANDYIKNKESKKENKQPSILFVIVHYVSLPGVFVWSYICHTLKKYTDPIHSSFMMTIDRIVVGLLSIGIIYTSNKMRSILTKVSNWSGLRILGRIAMSVSMVHWCVNKTLVGSRIYLLDASVSLLILDTMGVAIISIALAIPMTLMVEYPMGKLLDKLLSLLL